MATRFEKPRCEACGRVTELWHHRKEDAYFCDECFELMDSQGDLFDEHNPE